MKCYIEITLLPGIEIPIYFLWEKVYQQLHLALVEIQDDNGVVRVGVSFPEYDEKKYQLGCKLRLFAPSKKDLEALNIHKWLSRLTDYIHVTSIREVPGKPAGYAFFKRIQTKSSNTRLARRKAKREGISYEDAFSSLSKRREQISKVPYLHFKSLSTDKRYRLMIACVETEQRNSHGDVFSTYGLSAKSPVPMF
ncbi:MAG: type I-F CRISPR-associated endoribonuclease Cas6/Csy4 [Desulfocapsa sp.]|uniref:Type I-F CRISPR-associated endoribonuclease Cas6/Csy4 n=1 Tax=Desulfotalea psychrophila TaxID=84980 RepID=A0ABS3AV03_9BACT|nr:type I-F CRISPR-associated endoribonuclease Cas6/Csy4 [Desulfocapsa sp.]MBN4068598.1 type I-F CRISPR-associated endoribonuclease Cas6/Csy4 [Desulfotalea psychrophila]